MRRSPDSKEPPHFDFIPVDGTRRVTVSQRLFTPRNRLQTIYTLDLTFICFSPVHVGSGNETLIPERSDAQPRGLALRTSTGTLCIPGSTLKGLVSSNYLILSGSIEETSECFGTSRFDRHGGHGPLLSKVFFADAVPDQPLTPFYTKVDRAWGPDLKRSRPRHVKIYTGRASPTTPAGDVECIPKGAILSTQIVGIELRNFELGGLLMSLGLDAVTKPKKSLRIRAMKVGYGKPQGLGLIRVGSQKSSIQVKQVKGLGLSSKTHQLASNLSIDAIEAFVKHKPKREIRSIWGKIFTKEPSPLGG